MRARSPLFLAILLALAGCDHDSRRAAPTGGGATGGDDPAPATTTLTVTPSLGLITQGHVSVQQLGGTWQVTGSTGTAGIALFTVPLDLAGPLLVTVCGEDSGSSYYDEALDGPSPLGPTQCLRAVLPDLSRSNIGVTALTEAAVRRLESQAELSAASATDIGTALEFVRSQVLPEVPDLLQAPTLVGAASDLALLPNDDAGRYALKLAALALAAEDLDDSRGDSVDNPAYALADMLGLDLADGVFDGQSGGSFILSPVYDIFQLDRLLDSQLQALAGSSDSLAALVASLDRVLAAPTLPAGGDALLSWQGDHDGAWSDVMMSAGTITDSPLMSAFQSQLNAGGACRISIDNDQLMIANLPFGFSFDTSAVSDVDGFRRYSFSRTDAVKISLGVSSVPATLTSSATLVTQGDQLLRVEMRADANTLGMSLSNVANGLCSPASAT